MLSADAYTGLSETRDHGYPLLEHIQRLVNGEIIWAPAIAGAFVLTTRGGDFGLHIGQDVSIGYSSHADAGVHLYLQETSPSSYSPQRLPWRRLPLGTRSRVPPSNGEGR